MVEAWALPFEHALPVRAFASYRRQRNLPGLLRSATTNGHVGYESWLERDQVMLLDFDPSVVGISSQPFRLLRSAANGRPAIRRRERAEVSYVHPGDVTSRDR
ncbi:hypothetical protein [Streptomyces sp. NPDC023327]|uniref:hypothetical protein n=1 Tax=Streptomyces sp. NPDC023327 TaxID=3157088 RepID=UPI0033C9696F